MINLLGVELPTAFLIGAVVIVLFLIILSKSRPRRGEAEPGYVEEKRADITDLIGKPGKVEEAKPSSIEAMLAGEVDDAPSIGEEKKTNVESTLDLLKTGEEPEAPKPEAKPKPAPKAVPKPASQPEKGKKVPEEGEEKGLGEAGGPLLDIDDLEEEIEEKEKKVPQKTEKPKSKLGEVRRELEKGFLKKMFGEKIPEKIGDKGVSYYCMECFDRGLSPEKTLKELRHVGVRPGQAKEVAYKTYKLWLDKREPVLREIKGTNEKLKRIHYKFLKRQIDEPTRKQLIIESQKRLVELEGKLKSTEELFTQTGSKP